jgi:hypothetical protein
MRATINFDLDVGDVEETMGSLASMQVPKLQMAIDELEIDSSRPLRDEIAEAISLIQSVSSQLQQYHSMLVSFEQARFQTMVPQDVDEKLVHSLNDVRQSVNSMKKFDDFLERATQPGDTDGSSQEG